MPMSIAPGLVLCILMVVVADVSAQLTAAKDRPIVYGHHHLNTTNLDAQKKFFVDTLGGVPIKVGTNNLGSVKFPNVLIKPVPGTGRRGRHAGNSRKSHWIWGTEPPVNDRQVEGRRIHHDHEHRSAGRIAR